MTLTAEQIDNDIRNELYGWSDEDFEALMAKKECQRLRNELVAEYEGSSTNSGYYEELEVVTEAIAQQEEEDE